MFFFDEGRFSTWRVGPTKISPLGAILSGEYPASSSDRGRRPVQGICWKGPFFSIGKSKTGLLDTLSSIIWIRRSLAQQDLNVLLFESRHDMIMKLGSKSRK
ncbi:hypothetical protein HG531_012129 [Fusarium graminearum]|nr:hypothetical protein HG531_012129 [Fusarium graminearum]